MGSWEPRRGRDPRRPGHSTASPGDEEDDSQRLSGDGEDVKSERGPEGDEGTTKEHGSRHDDLRSQSRGPEGPAVPSGQRVLDTGRGWVAKLRGSVGAADEEAPVRRGLEMPRAGRGSRGGAFGALVKETTEGASGGQASKGSIACQSGRQSGAWHAGPRGPLVTRDKAGLGSWGLSCSVACKSGLLGGARQAGTQ